MDLNVARCLMTDAIDGPGIAYWAEARRVKRNAEKEVESFEVRDGGFEGERESESWVAITEDKIRAAAKDMTDGKVACHKRIAAQFIGSEWDYDVDGIDCLIQHIVFKKIIYG